MNSHAIPLQIAAADHAQRAMSGKLNDDRIMHGIVSTHLLIAAATPRAQLESLYDSWNRQDCPHPAYARALCVVLESLDMVMVPAELTV